MMSVFDLFRRLFRRRRPGEPRSGKGRRHVFSAPAHAEAPWLSLSGEQDTAEGPLQRLLVLVRPKAPYVDWVRRTTGNRAFTLAQAQREDLRAYLVPTWDWDLEEGEDFVAQHWQHFFAQALEDWELDRSRWPKQRTPAMFRGWFEVTVCCGVLDLGGHPGQED